MPTSCNIAQHGVQTELNMLCPTCWHNMLRSLARAFKMKYKILLTCLQGNYRDSLEFSNTSYGVFGAEG